MRTQSADKGSHQAESSGGWTSLVVVATDGRQTKDLFQGKQEDSIP